jgi:hypothetical protein
MKLTPGRTVLYKLTREDCLKVLDQKKPCNVPSPGDIVPAVTVRIWNDICFNGRAFLDGDVELWLCSVTEGLGHGQWQWPTLIKEDPAPAPQSFIMRYHRLFNLGNFQNEAIEIERSFPDGVSPVEALKYLKNEVISTRNEVITQEQKLQRYCELREHISENENAASKFKEELGSLEKELKITLDDERIMLTEKGRQAAESESQ